MSREFLHPPPDGGPRVKICGITSAEGVCSRMASSLAQVGPSLAADSTNETPDAVFTRLGGGR